MKKTTFAATLLSSANFAFAAPVYLDCVTKFDSPPPGAASEFRFSVKIDEASGNVTHTDSDGSAFNAKGFFSAREVGYNVESESDTFNKTIAYKIDRSNLSVVRTFYSELSESGKRALQKWDDTRRATVTKGVCTMADVKHRKF
jgi:hypothetical protein